MNVAFYRQGTTSNFYNRCFWTNSSDTKDKAQAEHQKKINQAALCFKFSKFTNFGLDLAIQLGKLEQQRKAR